jgi:Uri superfamily endonuclease
MIKGIYVLVLSVSKNLSVNVGALGSVSFEKGFYVYVGSAQNNLEKRIGRHFKQQKKVFWHIDYLVSRKEVEIVKVFRTEGGREEECRIAAMLGSKDVSISGFGSSDCVCKSHLFKLDDWGFLRGFMQEMR